MAMKIALAGNPNCGKTTLFNALTGANQYIGNWPGVTVEKKEGKLKGHSDIVITDLPGIYSLSPYTLEEVVARNYLINERPDAILNIIDGTNLERNLYLSTQVVELGIPVVMAVNMMDLVEKAGDKIYIDKLSEQMGCEVVEISALKGTGIAEATEKVVKAAESGAAQQIVHKFDKKVEDALASIEEKLGDSVAEAQKRFFAIKLLENDSKIAEQMKSAPDVSAEISAIEEAFDDDSESVITSERYEYISSIIGSCMKKAAGNKEKLSTSDKIDRVVTNRILALPIFALVMFLVYYIAMSTIGAAATDWTNDNLFGDGFHLFGMGTAQYEEASEEYGGAAEIVNGFAADAAVDEIADALDEEAEEYDPEAAAGAVTELVAMYSAGDMITYEVEDEETLEISEEEASYEDLTEAVAVLEAYGYESPDPADYGTFIPSIPDAIAGALESVNCAEWLSGLILDGIVAGLGAVLGFVPQMLVLFFLLAILEYCGYMARIAFILDRIFRRFGLSGKSFIPMLVSMGCGIPGVMASRTIENEKDRRMTIMTTTFIPCGAKVPFIAMIVGALLGGNPFIATACYFMGVAAVICSGIILKKTRLFAGDPAPFVMELPAYHMPTIGSILRSTWERGWSFIKKAGTIITLSTIVIWFTTYFGFAPDGFRMLAEEEIDYSILATIGNALAWIFIPQGWGNWQAVVASITGLVAKENIVGTLGILYANGEGSVWQNMAAAFAGTNGSTIAVGYSFLLFNLLCAPCFAAMGAIKREMNNAKWFWIAIGYQCGLAYLVSLVVYRIVGLFTGECGFGIFTIIAIAIIIGFIYLLFRPMPKEKSSRVQVKGMAKA
ncbi:MAG: ferrous iron transporter B [Lachnospiraceae bacterium]|nr:ferrous iron transporter B [Lachnospiraceae bacterium]